MTTELSLYFQKLTLKFIVFIALAYGVYTLAWLIMGVVHSFPNVEDLELASWARDIGVARAFINLSITYDGRYATNFLQCFNPLVWNFVAAYPLIISFSLFLFIAGTFLSLSVFFQAKWHVNFVVSLVFVSVYFSIIPGLAYALYWMGSSFVYLYGSIFFMFFFSFCYLYWREKQGWKQFIFFALSGISLFMSIGFGESYLPLYFLLFAFGLFYALLHIKYIIKFLPLAIIALASASLMIFSPGVIMRVSEKSTAAYFQLDIFLSALQNYFIWLQRFFSCFEIYILALLIFILQWSKRIRVHQIFSGGQLFLLSLAWLVLPFCMLLPFHLVKISTGGFTERIFIPLAFVQLFFLIIFLLPQSFSILCKKIKEPLLNSTIFAFLFLLFLIHSNKENNINLIEKEYNEGKLTAFKKIMSHRYELLSKNRNAISYSFICIDDLKDYPHSLYTHPDPENNRSNSKWNKFLEAYFKIDEIKTPEDKSLKFSERINSN